MRITKLQLQDYKCFENLVLEGLGDRVVLVGPNGCGKSAILAAIAELKEFVATYSPQPQTYYRQIPTIPGNVLAWPESVPLPIRSDRPFATITVEVALDDAEQHIAGGLKNGSVSIRIERTGRVVVPPQNPEGLNRLFSHYDPESGIGVVDYISPNRTFPNQKSVNINLGAISVKLQRTERIELPRTNFEYNKFRTVKDFLVATDFDEFIHLRETGEELGDMKLLQELFSEFFGPKRLVGCKRQEDEIQVAIRTPFGDHDIDQLSSGEKELFFIFVNLFRIRKLPSVILYDEPERHLNPGLESKIIPALDRLQTRNQLWLATHGAELIGSVPMQDIVALKKESEHIQYERFADSSRTELVRLLERLGAKVGLQLACNRVVFLEGKNSQADKRILDKLAGPKLPGVLFVASGSSLGVMGAGTRAGLLIEAAGKEASFLMVLDRDYREAGSVTTLEKKLANHVYVWKCHEVENLLLTPEAILEVLTNSDVDTFKTSEDVKRGLQGCANQLEELFVSQWAAYRICNQGPGEEEESIRPNNETNLRKLVDKARKWATTAYSEATLDATLAAAKKVVRQCLGTNRWMTELPGKEILDTFRQTYLPSVQADTFKAQVVSAMVRSNLIPQEIVNLCDFINSH